jgi:hypothetical protein
MAEVGSIFDEFGAVMTSIRPREDAGDKGTAADSASWGMLSFEMRVSPEMVGVCDEEGRGGLFKLTLNDVTAGGGDGGKLPEPVVDGKPDSAF